MQTNNKVELSSSDDSSVAADRKILQASTTNSGWINYPEKAFDDDCGAIKIGPTVQGMAR